MVSMIFVLILGEGLSFPLNFFFNIFFLSFNSKKKIINCFSDTNGIL